MRYGLWETCSVTRNPSKHCNLVLLPHSSLSFVASPLVLDGGFPFADEMNKICTATWPCSSYSSSSSSIPFHSIPTSHHHSPPYETNGPSSAAAVDLLYVLYKPTGSQSTDQRTNQAASLLVRQATPEDNWRHLLASISLLVVRVQSFLMLLLCCSDILLIPRYSTPGCIFAALAAQLRQE